MCVCVFFYTSVKTRVPNADGVTVCVVYACVVQQQQQHCLERTKADTHSIDGHEEVVEVKLDLARRAPRWWCESRDSARRIVSS